jgi:putative transposase
MARKPRHLVVIPNQPHHVILRGNNRRRLFSYPNDHRFFLTRLGEASRKREVSVHTTMLMTNHVHLIVTPSSVQDLSKFVAYFARAYAQERNRKRHSSGKLFEERFNAKPITSEEQMAITTSYIELNPVLAGLCRDARHYRWSTFHRHAGLPSLEPLMEKLWTPSSWFLSLGRDPSERCAAFIDWFEHYRERNEWPGLSPNLRLPIDHGRIERPDRRRAS